MKKIFKWVGIAILLVFAGLAFLPLVIPVKPLSGLSAPRELASTTDQFIKLPFKGTDGIDIRYLDTGGGGDGRTFVLLHGSLFNASTWDEVTDTFATRGRVVAYDQIPYGLSEKMGPKDWTGESPYQPNAAVERKFLLMDALNIERATLVANSYGAVLAVQAAIAQPARIEGLVLGDPAVYVDENMPAWVMKLPQVRRMGPLLARAVGTSQSFVDSTWFSPTSMTDARRAKTFMHTGVENWDVALWEYLKVWKLPDLSSAIDAISQPTLVITGENDAIVPLADSQRLAETIPGAELVVLPNCGHVPQEECPAKFSAAVIDWIDRKF